MAPWEWVLTEIDAELQAKKVFIVDCITIDINLEWG